MNRTDWVNTDVNVHAKIIKILEGIKGIEDRLRLIEGYLRDCGGLDEYERLDKKGIKPWQEDSK